MMYLSIVSFALLGGWLSRMCGGGPPKLPWGLDQWIYALPYMVVSIPAVTAIATIFSNGKISIKHEKHWFALAALPYAGAFLGKRTGHGGGIDAGTSTKERDDEALEFLIKPLHEKISEYWYDIILLSVTGVATTFITGIFVMCASVPAGLLIIVSGLLKGPAYMIGWAIYPEGTGRGIPHLNEATAIGEFLTGFFGYAALGVALIIILAGGK